MLKTYIEYLLSFVNIYLPIFLNPEFGFVVKHIATNGVLANSVIEYKQSISNNFPFLTERLEISSHKACREQAEIVYILSQVNNPKVKNIDIIKKGAEIFATFGGDMGKEAKPIDNAEKEKYEKDPSLFLEPITQAIEILVKKAENSNVETEFGKFEIAEDIGLLQSIIAPDRQLFKCLGTASQVEKIKNKLPSIELLYAESQKFRDDLGLNKVEKYEGMLDQLYTARAELRKATLHKGRH